MSAKCDDTAGVEDQADPLLRCPICDECYINTSSSDSNNEGTQSGDRSPVILTCCGNSTCHACFERHRASKTAELPGNRKRIKCMMCNRPFHCEKGTPYVRGKIAVDPESLSSYRKKGRQLENTEQSDSRDSAARLLINIADEKLEAARARKLARESRKRQAGDALKIAHDTHKEAQRAFDAAKMALEAAKQKLEVAKAFEESSSTDLEYATGEMDDAAATSESLKEALSTLAPPEAKLKSKPKKFEKMGIKEREEFLSDREYEEEFVAGLIGNLTGAVCAICNVWGDESSLSRCSMCGVVVHRDCYYPTAAGSDSNRNDDIICYACKFVAAEKEHGREDIDKAVHCSMCNQVGGSLKKAFAVPFFKESLFGHQLFCHDICVMWHPQCSTIQRDGEWQGDCTLVSMSNGFGHVLEAQLCALCCRHDKVKVKCHVEKCRAWGETKGPYRFHVSCARQAGLYVGDQEIDGEAAFQIACFEHMPCEFALRAKLEDMIENERQRTNKDVMTVAHAAVLHHWAVTILQCLGWAWRWAEWWVEKGDNWEPLLEPGQREDGIIKDELRIIDSTRESRCADARRCRLVAFGAAIRNRDYDKEEDDDCVALDRALRAVLHTKSLVGPLEQYEIDFSAEWLARAYRSKSKLLGFGDEKNPVANFGRCMHKDDGSPKYELGARTLPGKQLLNEGEVFESAIDEVDDFLKPETFEGDGWVSARERIAHRKHGNQSLETGNSANDDDDDD